MKGKFLAHPGYGNLWHIYDNDNGNRSLCGRSIMLRVDDNQCEKLNNQTWLKGQDCKACFKRAGLLK